MTVALTRCFTGSSHTPRPLGRHRTRPWGRGTRLLGHSWQAGFALGEFSLNICLKNVSSKEAKRPISARTLSEWVGGGERASSLLIHRLQEVPRTDISTLPVSGQNLQEWPALPGACLSCSMDTNRQGLGKGKYSVNPDRVLVLPQCVYCSLRVYTQKGEGPEVETCPYSMVSCDRGL